MRYPNKTIEHQTICLSQRLAVHNPILITGRLKTEIKKNKIQFLEHGQEPVNSRKKIGKKMEYENISELNIGPKEILNKSISVRSSREPKRRVLSTKGKKSQPIS